MEIIFTIFVHLGRKMEDEKNSVKYKQLILVSRYGQKVVPVYTILEYSVLARLSAHTAWISCLHLPQLSRRPFCVLFYMIRSFLVDVLGLGLAYINGSRVSLLSRLSYASMALRWALIEAKKPWSYGLLIYLNHFMQPIQLIFWISNAKYL